MRRAVAAGAPGTVEVALDVLARGGNAVDAAVAAGFLMPVTEPGLASLGGGGFMMVRGADGHTELIDFFAAVPTPNGEPMEVVTVEFTDARQDFAVGSGSVAVPGMLPGLLHAHDRFGRMAREDVIDAALTSARGGAVMTQAQALVLSLIGVVLTLTPESAAVYAPGGEMLQAGQTLHNPDYVGFLEQLRDGLDALPALAPLHAGDLAAYRVFEREPLRLELGDLTVLTNPAPSMGGAIVAQALSDLRSLDATARELLDALCEATEASKADGPTSVRGTTHISVSDGEQVVAMTVSNGSCSGVMLPGTGVQLNNMMGESDLHPSGVEEVVGARIRSMMAPTLVERGGLVTALGTGGSERIRSALVRVIALLGAGADLQAAIDAPRVHMDNDGVVQLEPGFPGAQVEQLPLPVSHWHDRDFYFGGVHAVSSDGAAAADARRGGCTGGV